jgi:hypothetical protein
VLSVLLSFFLALRALEAQEESNMNGTGKNLYSSSYALVIGIDDYENNYWKDLKNAVKDAGLVGNELEKKGFEVTYKYNLKLSEIEHVLGEFFYKEYIDNKSQLFIWYSGHGHTLKNEGFLVPSDAPEAGSPSFKRKALPVRRFDEWSRLTDAKHVYMVFDSCFSSTNFIVKDTNDYKSIQLALKDQARQFLCSCVDGQKRLDDGDLREMFISAFRNEMDANANNDNYLTASELGIFIKNRIATKTVNNQIPQYGKLKDFNEGDFVFSLGSITINSFRDLLKNGISGPEMVEVPRGPFRMGDIRKSGYENEKPVHDVMVGSIYVGRFEVTFEEYDRFCDDTKRKKPDDNGWGRGFRPVINVSWKDAIAYTKWLRKQTGHTYRLPTEG